MEKEFNSKLLKNPSLNNNKEKKRFKHTVKLDKHII